jgi:ferric-dicitrate binding protein FerR (iron transport regulator)
MRVAAAAVFGFLLGTFFEYQNKTSDTPPQVVSQYDVIVPYGSRTRIVLADGTKVWLNAGSRLRYATDFGHTGREVFLEGEGYFDVARDTTRLFVVKTDKLDVKALGTAFNVKAYPGEENIETVLVTGKVSVGNLVLAPSEKLVYTRKDQKMVIEKKVTEMKQKIVAATKDENRKTSIVQPVAKIVETPVDPVIYTSWKDDLWRVESETLGSLAVKLERRYDVTIRFADRGTRLLSINAAIRDESLEQVLRFLRLSVPIDFNIEGKTVVLKENKYLKEKYREYYRQKEE